MTTKIIFSGLLLLVSLSIFTSCSIDKRLYTSGYDIQWHNNKTEQTEGNNIGKNNSSINEKIAIINSQSIENMPEIDNTISASINETEIVILKKEEIVSNKTENCDLIILKNGDEINAKGTEITIDAIKYKKCDNLNGPTYPIKKSKVFMLKYPNATKDIISPNNSTPKNISENNNSSSANNDNTHKKTAGLAVAVFVIGLVGLVTPLGIGLVCELLALIFGAVSLAKIKRHPDEYKGKGLAITSLILGLVAFGIGLLVTVALSGR